MNAGDPAAIAILSNRYLVDAHMQLNAEDASLAPRLFQFLRPRGEAIEEKAKTPDFKPKRWVVEVCHSWFNRFRKILVRYEKMDRSYRGY